MDPDTQRQEPGAKLIFPGVYLLAELLNSTKQTNLFRSLRSVSAQMRYNPGPVMPTTESIATAGNAQASVWKTRCVADPGELLVPTRILKRHQTEQMVLLNTWKDDDVAVPFEWVDICDKAADLVNEILSPFFPAVVHSSNVVVVGSVIWSLTSHCSDMHFGDDQTRFRSDAKRPGWRVWVSLGCTAHVAVQTNRQNVQLDMLSGDALVVNTSPRYHLDIAVLSILPGTCPPPLTSLDVRLDCGRCNLILAEEATYERLHDKERLLRRTFEIHRKKLWRKQAPTIQ